MKFAVTLCAVLSFAVVATAFRNVSDESLNLDDYLSLDIFHIESIDQLQITDEQKRCILNPYNAIIDNNIEMGVWLTDLQQTSQKLASQIQTCQSLEGIPKSICLSKAIATVVTEARRLQNSLPENAQEVFQLIGQSAIACLRPENEIF